MISLEKKKEKILDSLKGLELDLESKEEFVDALLYTEYDLSRNAKSEDVLYYTNGNNINGLINLTAKKTIPYLEGTDMFKNHISFDEDDCDVYLEIPYPNINSFARLLDFRSYACTLVTDTGLRFESYSGYINYENRLLLSGKFNDFPGTDNLPSNVNKLYIEVISSVKGKTYYIKLMDKTKF